MSCPACQNRIETALKGTGGISGVSVDYLKGTANVQFDSSVITKNEIIQKIEKLGYGVLDEAAAKTPPFKTALQIAGTLVIILAIAALMRAFSTSSFASAFPVAQQGMGFGMVFIIGLLTGVHCIAMCGGINLSQTLNRGEGGAGAAAGLTPSVLYNAGRIVSYTAVGVAVGAIGSVLNVSERFRGIILFIAGLLMLLMGLNMLGLFPVLRRFTPRLKGFIPAGKGPFIVGLLNGFMPCGPLQAMQLYALSTGSPIAGGLSMFLFSAGTVPMMFALGAAGGLLGTGKGRVISRRVMQAGSAIIAGMGIVMLVNGWNSAGITLPPGKPALTSRAGTFTPNIVDDGMQLVNSTLTPGRYPAITVQQGIPVRWVINAPPGSINGCNSRFFIREYGIEYTLKPGENVIEFMPEKSGKFRYSCWMSMIHSTITVLAPGETLADAGEPAFTPDTFFELRAGGGCPCCARR
jgi:sulfite exporter TauE/SafE/copper chaperone CopZ